MTTRKFTLASIMAIGLICLGTSSLSAQNRQGGAGRAPYRPETRSRQDFYHFAYASASIGYTSLEEGIKHVTPIGGLGNQVGIGYEFRYQNFWLSVGGQLNWIRTQNLLESYTVDHNIEWQNAIPHSHQNNGGPANLVGVAHYQVSQQDDMNVMMVDVPLLLGYYYQGFYIGAGAKVGFGLDTKISAKGSYDLTADATLNGVPYYSTPFDLGKYDFQTEQPIRFAPQVSICGETGFDVLSMMPTRSPFCHVLKVGFYFEVGVNSMVRPISESAHLMTYNGQAPTTGTPANQVEFNPYYTSGMTEPQRVAPFYTGFKVTYMFGGNKNSNHGVAHRGCQCYE